MPLQYEVPEVVLPNGASFTRYVSEEALELWIHNGKAFGSSDVHAAVAAGANLDHLIQVGDNPVHLYALGFDADGGPINSEIYEGTVVSAAGTAHSIVNLNRSFAAVAPSCAVSQGPTITTIGTKLLLDVYSGTGAPHEAASTGLPSEEMILAPNTNYLFRIHNGDTNPHTITMLLSLHIPELRMPAYP